LADLGAHRRQIGILVGAPPVSNSAPAPAGSDAFFWSQPARSLIPMNDLLHPPAMPWTDISFTFRSTISGFLSGRPLGSLLGLSLWWSRTTPPSVQPYIMLPGIDPENSRSRRLISGIRDRPLSKLAVATAVTLVVSTLTAYAGVRPWTPTARAVLLAWCFALASVPQARRSVLPAWIISVTIGRHVSASPWTARQPSLVRFIILQHGLGTADPLRRSEPMTSPLVGWRCSCSHTWRSSCMRGGVFPESMLRKACGNDAIQKPNSETSDRPKICKSTDGRSARAWPRACSANLSSRRRQQGAAGPRTVHSTGYLPMYIAMAKLTSRSPISS